MNILLIMIPLSVLLIVGGVFAFFWAVNNDQFDDMQSPAHQPLADKPDLISSGQTEIANKSPGQSSPSAAELVDTGRIMANSVNHQMNRNAGSVAERNDRRPFEVSKKRVVPTGLSH
ncbi:MAG TPA: cbb3-type cytochrome oxidase assembly protein CcoS [Spongiibacteraceae bacterium]|nr:cbb3-type cytochrome oxidase assembly protein CcoS [Spongiibacteraceae bacterium]HCS26004.1 cbb3-type cytochrome oxidase assembly protein CcoS [Spongiibacteraceae bacterium]